MRHVPQDEHERVIAAVGFFQVQADYSGRREVHRLIKWVDNKPYILREFADATAANAAWYAAYEKQGTPV